MSALSGMTGFGRAAGSFASGTWTWEARSVNGRGLDVRVNTPSGFEALQALAKKLAASRFTRGSLQVSLRIEISEEAGGVSVDKAALANLIETYSEQMQGTPPSGEALATLMTARGILQESQTSFRDLAQLPDVMSALEEGLEHALGQLLAERQNEGASLANVLSGALKEMTDLVETAEASAGQQPAALKQRLEQQLIDIGAEKTVDADRLAAEVALAAAKADVREELDRLKAHFVTGQEHLKVGSPVGRKLDFLAQELNREANTLCSKSTSLDLTNAGLGLKAVIDQFKEQAANVE